MTTSTVTTCPTWCSTHTMEDGITLHERRVVGDRWELILTHETTEGTTVDVGLPSDRSLSPTEALTLGHALIESATMAGQETGR